MRNLKLLFLLSWILLYLPGLPCETWTPEYVCVHLFANFCYFSNCPIYSFKTGECGRRRNCCESTITNGEVCLSHGGGCTSGGCPSYMSLRGECSPGYQCCFYDVWKHISPPPSVGRERKRQRVVLKAISNRSSPGTSKPASTS